MTSPENFQLWQLAQLAALVAELDYAVGVAHTQVVYDVPLRSRITGEARQFDVVVYVHVGPIEAIRVVEVQRRSGKFGEPEVEQLDAKARSVGASELTLVSAAGYTRGAEKFIAAKQPFIDARMLTSKDRVATTDQVHVMEFQLCVEGEEPQNLTLQRFRYEAVVGGRGVDVFLAPATLGDAPALVAATAQLDEKGEQTIRGFILPRGETATRLAGGELTGWTNDGRSNQWVSKSVVESSNPFIDPAKRRPVG